jgi:hypothetical protein
VASPSQSLVNQQLGGAVATLYMSATGTWTQLTKLLLVNTDTAVHQVTLYVVPSGASSGTTFITTAAQALLAGQSWNDPNEYGLVLGPGAFLAGFADTGGVVNIQVAGLLLT